MISCSSTSAAIGNQPSDPRNVNRCSRERHRARRLHRRRRRGGHQPRPRTRPPRDLGLPARERGGDTLESDSQELYRGEAPGGGLIEAPAYLWSSRLRFLGGTTNHWAGYCAPLDPIDFAVRDWIPHSGWPFGRETLEPWYHRAAELLEIRPFDYEPAQLSDAPLPLDEAGLETALYHLSPPTRFGSRYRPQLAAAHGERGLERQDGEVPAGEAGQHDGAAVR